MVMDGNNSHEKKIHFKKIKLTLLKLGAVLNIYQEIPKKEQKEERLTTSI